jgi:hypothetical protein
MSNCNDRAGGLVYGYEPSVVNRQRRPIEVWVASVASEQNRIRIDHRVEKYHTADRSGELKTHFAPPVRDRIIPQFLTLRKATFHHRELQKQFNRRGEAPTLAARTPDGAVAAGGRRRIALHLA